MHHGMMPEAGVARPHGLCHRFRLPVPYTASLSSGRLAPAVVAVWQQAAIRPTPCFARPPRLDPASTLPCAIDPYRESGMGKHAGLVGAILTLHHCTPRRRPQPPRLRYGRTNLVPHNTQTRAKGPTQTRSSPAKDRRLQLGSGGRDSVNACRHQMGPTFPLRYPQCVLAFLSTRHSAPLVRGCVKRNAQSGLIVTLTPCSYTAECT